MEREIWFEKVLWGYMPCHWKGLAAMAGVIIPAVAVILLGQMALDAFNYSEAAWLPLLIILPVLFSLLAIAKRHS